MSGLMEFYTKDDAASMQIGRNVYRRVSIPIDDFNAACDRYGFVLERTCHWEYPQGVNGWLGYMVCSECDAKILDEWTIDTPNYCPNCGARVTPKNSETTQKVVSE